MRLPVKFLFFSIIFIISSCVNNGDEFNDRKPVNNQLNEKNDMYERNTSTQSISVLKIRLYSYITGKILVSNNLVRDVFRSVASNNNGIINLSQELQTGIINNSFLIEAQRIRSVLRLNLGFDDSPLLRGPGLGIIENLDPPIDDSVNNPSELYNQWMQQLAVVEGVIDELQSNLYEDCIEIYVKRPFTKIKHLPELSLTTQLYVAPHPLNNDNFVKGYLFTYNINGEGGSSITINPDFLLFHPHDVIIVRPVRNQICSYSDIYVTDFTDFLNN